jgi:hypothetical protein
MYLPRDEMAFRKRYEELVTKQLLTTVFRPGNRVYPQWRGYKPGEIVTARVIEQYGSDEKGIPPVFKPIKILVRIKNIRVKNIHALDAHDFSGSSPDVCDIQSLKQHLHYIYGKDVRYFNQQITKINLEYLVAN